MRRGLLPLALGSIWIAPGALAQDRSGLPPGAVVQPMGDTAGSELNRNLTALAQNPRSVEALNGAGAAALDMGDPNAALNFFTRALDADPSSARAKAGMAQALVRQERASEALPLFTEAVRMGVPEAEIAADRGLAWDTLGFPARAQADYALALRREDDPEVRRRLALSLAITGQRAEALRMIDPQLRVNDRAGWRTQAFILALTGDPAGAGQTARQMMPGAADQLAPFFQRLAALSPSQKALAVHFGHFPSDGRAQNYAQADSAADPGALAMARGSVPMGQARVRSREVSPLDFAAVRRRPDADQATLSAQVRPAPARSAAAAPRRQYSPSVASFLEGASTGEGGPPPQRYASTQPGGSAPAWPTPVLDERQNNYPSHPPAPPPPPPMSFPQRAPNQYQPQNNPQSPGFTLVPQGRPLGHPAIVQPEPQTSFDAVRSAVNALKDEAASEGTDPAEDAAPPVRSQPVRSAPVRQAQAPASRRQTPVQANPSRAWVQVATGSNRAGLIFTYGQFRRRAGALLSGRAPYSAPNRLLVGPFPNEAAASSFARQLSARGVPSHSWTSDAGQRIDQLQAAASSDDSPTPTRTRTAASERSSGTRNGRGSSGSRSERTSASSRSERNTGNGSSRNRHGTSSRDEQSASNGRGRHGASSSRSGTSRNERSAGNSSRNERNGNGRNGRSGSGNSRTASAGTSHDRSGSGHSDTRNSRSSATTSARSSRGGSGGQSRSSSRRGR
jgi:Flp pilus assembly protein TadD